MSVKAEAAPPITTVEPLIEPSIEEVVPTIEEVAASPQKQFLAHFRQYPLVNSTREAVFTIPFTRRCAVNLGHTLQAIRDTNPIKAVMDRGDLIADGALNQVDFVVPGLKTIDYPDLYAPITRPVNGAIEGTQRALTNFNGAIQRTIVVPTARTATDVRDRFHYVIYDNDGKGIITSTADPLVAPLNEGLEGFVWRYFPETKPVSKNHSSELSRTVRIINNFVFRVTVPTTEDDVQPQANAGPAIEDQNEVDPQPKESEIVVDKN